MKSHGVESGEYSVWSLILSIWPWRWWWWENFFFVKFGSKIRHSRARGSFCSSPCSRCRSYLANARERWPSYPGWLDSLRLHSGSPDEDRWFDYSFVSGVYQYNFVLWTIKKLWRNSYEVVSRFRWFKSVYPCWKDTIETIQAYFEFAWRFHFQKIIIELLNEPALVQFFENPRSRPLLHARQNVTTGPITQFLAVDVQENILLYNKIFAAIVGPVLIRPLLKF